MNIRVAVFEDNALIRNALLEIINSTEGLFCCGAFENGKHLIHNIQQSEPDVIMMDIEMPGINGIEATAEVHKNFPNIKVLIQTVFDDGERIFKALCAGATGYILKNDLPQKQMDAVKHAYNGGAPMSPNIAKKILSFFQQKNVILVSPENEDYKLSDREIEILNLMREGLNSKAIADKIFISYETVRTHIKHIYKKLHVASRSEAIMKATQQGIR